MVIFAKKVMQEDIVPSLQECVVVMLVLLISKVEKVPS
jgi:hypothetical protein